MPTLLGLEISPRDDRSISRALGKRFIEHWIYKETLRQFPRHQK